MSYDDKDMGYDDLHHFVVSSFIAINNKNKLKLNGNPVLTYDQYNSQSKNKRNFQKDNTDYDYKSDCTIWGSLDFTRAKKGLIPCGNFGSDCKSNDWSKQGWDNQSGIIVAKKTEEINKWGNNKNIDGNIQYGYLKLSDQKIQIKQ